jgi:3,4-dihydroxy-2-butanone 4-phosphate synthase
MLGDDGRSLPKEKAMKYAKANGFKFIEGKEIIDALSISRNNYIIIR